MATGRSLSELGTTLRWSDLNAFLIHLPSTSHTRAQLAPDLTEETLRLEQWTRPEMLLLGIFYDAWERNELLRRAVEPEELPTKGIISRLLDRMENPTPSPTEQENPRPKTSAEITQLIKARETPAPTLQDP